MNAAAVWVACICGAAIPWFLALWFVTSQWGWTGGPLGMAFGVGAVLTGAALWWRRQGALGKT